MNKITVLVFILTLPILIISFKSQIPEWKGTITDEDGVIMVKNPKEPMYGEEVFSLDHELNIGQSIGSDEYLFSQVRGLAIDDEERIYVVDYDEANVKIFDKTGTHIKTFGKKGQGPGELFRPRHIAITYKNEIMLEDNFPPRIKFYTLEGDLIESLPNKGIFFLPRAKMDSSGHLIVPTFSYSDENRIYEIMRYDSELNFINTIASWPYNLPSVDHINPFGYKPWWDIDMDDKIIYGYTEKYEFIIADSEGKILKRITKEYDPVEVGTKMKKKSGEPLKKVMPQAEVSFPKYFPAFSNFLLDDEGRIYVQTYETVGDSDLYYFDVFDKEGKFTCKIKLKHRVYIFKKGKMYSVEEDEEGYQVVKRYKVTWNFG